MLGVAIIRQQQLHFTLFAVHVIGYSIADTALASLISRYSSPSCQGRDLALNQAAQSCARVLSPLIAGILYESILIADYHSQLYNQKYLPGILSFCFLFFVFQGGKSIGSLPVGALPFLVGSLFPAIAITIPSLLYIRSIANKRDLNKNVISS